MARLSPARGAAQRLTSLYGWPSTNLAVHDRTCMLLAHKSLNEENFGRRWRRWRRYCRQQGQTGGSRPAAGRRRRWRGRSLAAAAGLGGRGGELAGSPCVRRVAAGGKVDDSGGDGDNTTAATVVDHGSGAAAPR